MTSKTFKKIFINDPGWLNKAISEVDRGMEKEGGHDWGHLTRVLSQAYAIAASEEFLGCIDLDVLGAAVLFHDLVNLPKDAPNRREASTLSADRALRFFETIFEADQKAILKNAIEAHSFSAGIAIQCDEAKIVQDADRLESVGALAIARTFYVSGLMGSMLFHPEDPFGIAREKRNDRRYAVDHFYEKVLLLPDLMHSRYARTLARTRNCFLESFLVQLKSEIEV